MVFIEKYEFTYYDYLCYYSSIKSISEKFLYVSEDTSEYALEDDERQLEKKTGDKKHDKIFKEILEDKEEMAKFISHFIKFSIKPEKLEIYNMNFITKDFKYKQADVVYKIKEKEIYFLVEHQTKVDYSMSYRVLNYCIEIIRNGQLKHHL